MTTMTNGTIPGCYPPGSDPFAAFEMEFAAKVAQLVPGYPAPEVRLTSFVDEDDAPKPTVSSDLSANYSRLARGHGYTIDSADPEVAVGVDLYNLANLAGIEVDDRESDDVLRGLLLAHLASEQTKRDARNGVCPTGIGHAEGT